MKPFPPEIWSVIECSLACAAESKRLIEEAARIRAEAKLLRQDSALLLRSNPIARRERYLRKRKRNYDQTGVASIGQSDHG